MKKIYCFFVICMLGASLSVAKAQQLAFPGAQGFGAYATGGRGGDVVHVTNLKASGAGSLADAVSKPNRIVVFDVGGVIDISGGETITISDNITIAGQTAPGEGITVYGNRVIANGKNIIIRYLRMRGSIKMNSGKCTFTCDGASNVILDHCTISWGRWDNVHIANSTDITWQNCIIAEGIDPQNFGAITDGTRNWTITHCLWANNKSRNPKLKCYAQQINNVIFNYGNGSVGGHSSADNYQDLIGNYYISGPNTGTTPKYFDQWTATDHLYSEGNYTDDNRDGVLNGRLITDYNGATPLTTPSLVPPVPVDIVPAKQAYEAIVSHCGASLVRDSHDQRLINQLTALGPEGLIIYNESEVGGIGTINGGVKPQDSDNDGMPDAWETANGLNPSDASDAKKDSNGNGYTNIEDYINSLAVIPDVPIEPTDPNAGGGTPKGTSAFKPEAGQAYRILSYASTAYSPGATMNGSAHYLVPVTKDGRDILGTTTEFDNDDKALLWEFVPAEKEGMYNIRNVKTGLYIATSMINTTNGSVAKTADGYVTLVSEAPEGLKITYTGDDYPRYSGQADDLSFYRINAPSFRKYQLRVREYPDHLVWGAGNVSRPDMVFTFSTKTP